MTSSAPPRTSALRRSDATPADAVASATQSANVSELRGAYLNVAIIGVFAAAVGVGLWRHEPWRDELQAWMIVRASRTPTALVRNLRHEGHPIGWYAYLWLFAKLARGIWMLQFATWAASVATATLIMFRAPWKRPTRILIIFGYFFFYEYSVLARGYNLGAFFTIAALVCLRPCVRWLPFGIATAALALTSAFGTIIALALFIAVLVEQYANLRDHETRSRATVAIATFGSFAFLGLIQAQPTASTASFNSWNFSVDAHLASTAIAAVFRGLIPLPQFRHSWWNTSIGDGHTGIAAVIAIIAFIAIAYQLRRSRAAVVVWLLSNTMIVSILYLKLRQADAARYYGHTVLALIASLWLLSSVPGNGQTDPHQPTDAADTMETGDVDRDVTRKHKHKQIATTPWWFVAILALQCAMGFTTFAIDIAQPFTDAQATADWLRAHTTSSTPLIGCGDAAVSSVAGHLDRPIYFRQGTRTDTFVRWNLARMTEFTTLERAIATVRRPGSPQVLYISNQPIPSLAREERFSAHTGIVGDEHYWIYDVGALTEQELRELQDPCRKP